MKVKQGIPVSPGFAISPAVVLDAEDVPIPRRTVAPEMVSVEFDRLERAVAAGITEIEHQRDRAAAVVGPKLARIFDFHIGMLRDPQLVSQIKQLIDDDHVTAEHAVYVVLRRQAKAFAGLDGSIFRERVSDVWDLERRILKQLIGGTRAELSHLERDAVVVAHDLTPSQTAGLDTTRIKAIATDAGGPTSHTAILAHALGIPAIVGLEDITRNVNTGDTVIIDGHHGRVIIRPDAEQLMAYRAHAQRVADHVVSLDEAAGLPAVTRDGIEITIQANIEFPSEIHGAIVRGASGIGLYRTEFMYLASACEPTEQKQHETYVEAIEALAGRPLTVRTVDLGADKIPQVDEGPDHVEPNPFLGCRSIRLCLQNLSLFKTQLRAILRASVAGPVKIMFPLISNVMELRQARMILGDVQEDLDDAGVPYDRDMAVGIMIEVPSAAIQARVLAREVDFFSIGTNDLIQYTLAVDRGNERIASLYSAAHPAVLRLIKDVLRSGRRAGIDVSLCGEMGGEPEFVMLLLGMGLTSLSITPPAIPGVKKLIRSVTRDECQRVARRALRFDSDREVINYLRDETRRVDPEAIDELEIDF